MSRRPQPPNEHASSSHIPTTTSSSSYPDLSRPPPADRATSEPFGGYDVPASSTTPRPLRSILTNPIPPPVTPRVRFLIPQSSTGIRERGARGGGLGDSPESTASTASRDGNRSDSEDDGSPIRPSRRSVP